MINPGEANVKRAFRNLYMRPSARNGYRGRLGNRKGIFNLEKNRNVPDAGLITFTNNNRTANMYVFLRNGNHVKYMVITSEGNTNWMNIPVSNNNLRIRLDPMNVAPAA